MKLKKFVRNFIPYRASLLIKVTDGVRTEKTVGTDVPHLYNEHSDLLDCKVLQAEALNSVLGIVVSTTKIKETAWKEYSTFADKN